MRIWQETEVGIASLGLARGQAGAFRRYQAFWRPIEQPREFKRNKTRHLKDADGRATGPQRLTRLTGKPW